jgi:hypothetical protein
VSTTTQPAADNSLHHMVIINLLPAAHPHTQHTSFLVRQTPYSIQQSTSMHPLSYILTLHSPTGSPPPRPPPTPAVNHVDVFPFPPRSKHNTHLTQPTSTPTHPPTHSH